MRHTCKTLVARKGWNESMPTRAVQEDFHFYGLPVKYYSAVWEIFLSAPAIRRGKNEIALILIPAG